MKTRKVKASLFLISLLIVSILAVVGCSNSNNDNANIDNDNANVSQNENKNSSNENSSSNENASTVKESNIDLSKIPFTDKTISILSRARYSSNTGGSANTTLEYNDHGNILQSLYQYQSASGIIGGNINTYNLDSEGAIVHRTNTNLSNDLILEYDYSVELNENEDGYSIDYTFTYDKSYSTEEVDNALNESKQSNENTEINNTVNEADEVNNEEKEEADYDNIYIDHGTQKFIFDKEGILVKYEYVDYYNDDYYVEGYYTFENDLPTGLAYTLYNPDGTIDTLLSYVETIEYSTENDINRIDITATYDNDEIGTQERTFLIEYDEDTSLPKNILSVIDDSVSIDFTYEEIESPNILSYAESLYNLGFIFEDTL